jgi:hypothetical protein
MAKTKRYNGEDGSYVEDDAVPTAEQNAKNTEDAGQVELERIRDKAAAEPTSFKAAFAAARGAGDKTFEFGGKKYTTEMAGVKSTSKPAASRSIAPRGDDTANPDVKQGPKKGQYMSLQDRAREYEKARAASGVGMYGTKKSEPTEAKKTPGRGVINTRDIDQTTLLPKKMAKGGMTASRRADGIATRGKTRGKIC